jgi:hypothetical protein
MQAIEGKDPNICQWIDRCGIYFFLKHGPSFNKFRLDYDMDGGDSCRMVHRVLDLISKPVKHYPMDDIKKAGKQCSTH